MALHVQPHGYLAAVERLLLYDADGDVGLLAHERLLVCAVGEEIALHHIARAFKSRHAGQAVLCLIDALHLLLEQVAARLYMQHHVPFGHLATRVKSCHLGSYAQVAQVYLVVSNSHSYDFFLFAKLRIFLIFDG